MDAAQCLQEKSNFQGNPQFMDVFFAPEVETNAHVLGAKLEAVSARSQFWR